MVEIFEINSIDELQRVGEDWDRLRRQQLTAFPDFRDVRDMLSSRRGRFLVLGAQDGGRVVALCAFVVEQARKRYRIGERQLFTLSVREAALVGSAVLGTPEPDTIRRFLQPLGFGFQVGHRAHQLAHLVEVAAEVVGIEDLVSHQIVDVAQLLVGHRLDDGLRSAECLGLRHRRLAHHRAVQVRQVAGLVLEALHHFRAHAQLVLQLQVEVLQRYRSGLQGLARPQHQMLEPDGLSHDEEHALAEHGLGRVLVRLDANQRGKRLFGFACAAGGFEHQRHIARRALAQEHAVGLLPQRIGL